MKRGIAFTLRVCVWGILGWAVHKAVGGYTSTFFIIVTIAAVCESISRAIMETE